MQLQTLFWMVKSEHMALSDYNTRSHLQISLRSDHLSIDIAQCIIAWYQRHFTCNSCNEVCGLGKSE